MCLLCLMMNWKETPPSNCKMQSIVPFLTIEINSGAKIHCCSCIVYGDENVINLETLALAVNVPRREKKLT